MFDQENLRFYRRLSYRQPANSIKIKRPTHLVVGPLFIHRLYLSSQVYPRLE